MVGVQQVVRLFAKRRAEVVLVERLDIRILVREAQKLTLIEPPEHVAAILGKLGTVVDGLAAAAGAAAGTGHDFHEVIGDLTGANGVHQLSGPGQAGDDRQAQGDVPDVEGGLPPGLLAADLPEGIGGGIFPGSPILRTPTAMCA